MTNVSPISNVSGCITGVHQRMPRWVFPHQPSAKVLISGDLVPGMEPCRLLCSGSTGKIVLRKWCRQKSRRPHPQRPPANPGQWQNRNFSGIFPSACVSKFFAATAFVVGCAGTIRLPTPGVNCTSITSPHFQRVERRNPIISGRYVPNAISAVQIVIQIKFSIKLSPVTYPL